LQNADFNSGKRGLLDDKIVQQRRPNMKGNRHCNRHQRQQHDGFLAPAYYIIHCTLLNDRQDPIADSTDATPILGGSFRVKKRHALTIFDENDVGAVIKRLFILAHPAPPSHFEPKGLD
jgi:hypothetical protein